MNQISKRNTIVFFAIILSIFGAISVGSLPPAVAAQSTSDNLPTRTSTPSATATPSPTQSATTTPKTWVGRIVSNTSGVTEGSGSIFRVRVDGLADIPIDLYLGSAYMTATSGSKPEYGPYTAEFAPVTAGTWTVAVPSLGTSLEVVADNYNLVVIEFVQIPVPAATQTAQPTATKTPLAGELWEGRIVREEAGAGVTFARLLVKVTGRNGQPVQLSTPIEFINTALTGQKPRELGPNMVEFTGLTPGKYIIEPLGLGTRLEVTLKANVVTRVEFNQKPATATSTPTPIPPTLTRTPLPSSTNTPTPTPTTTSTATATASPTSSATPPPSATSTATGTPTPSPTPVASPTPVTRWIGAVAGRAEYQEERLPTMEVRVVGISGVPVQLRAVDGNFTSEQRCITGATGTDICQFREVTPGDYIVSPEGLNLSLPLTINANRDIQIIFDLEVLPPGITGWQSRVINNTNGVEAIARGNGIISARIDGRAGQIVTLSSIRGTERYCEATFNPLLDGLVCEFGGLGPGVYLVEVLHTGARRRIFVDGRGRADLIFSPNATYATEGVTQLPPVIGQGADPIRPNTPTPTATATLIPLPQPTATASPQPTSTPTPTLTPTITPTPTPAFAWQGRIVERIDGVAGTIGVRAAGLEGHPVIVRSGGWESPPQVTGTKPELGLYATEFGGLAQGEYIVELQDLAEIKVTLAGDQFLLIEFRYDFVNPPQPNE